NVIDDFARELFLIMRYKTNKRLLRTRHSIPLVICGENSNAQTDICLIQKKREFLLIVQDDKRFYNNKDPEVIAEAVAAFQENNRMRKEEDRILNKMVIPCITMIGTYPRFYLVPVTMELSNCIITGQYPTNNTEVLCYIPKIPKRISDGMK
ncbi:hypothetical protein BU17DRAFT_32085, partial [Hysterangium stoloniferum]